MELKYRYYIGHINSKGTVKCITENEVIGPYDHELITISRDGYATREKAIEAVAYHVNMYYIRYDYCMPYEFTIIEAITMEMSE